MTKKIFVFVLIIFVSLNYVTTTDAKDKKATSKNKPKTTKEKTDNILPTPFNINTEKLPPNFNGTDIVKLFSVLSQKAPLEKDEFETTSDYDKKIMDAFTTIANDVYAFKLDSKRADLSIHDYDADTQKLQIDVKTTPLSEYDFKDYRASTIIRHLYGGSKSFVGSNAFGAEVLVNSHTGTKYGIALVNQDNFGKCSFSGNHANTLFDSKREINLEIEMLPAKAKTLKNNIGVLLLCKPHLYKSNAKMKNTGNDLIFEDTYYAGATLDSPTELSYDRQFINVEVLAIWVYEVNTGSIILKKQLKAEQEQQGT